MWLIIFRVSQSWLLYPNVPSIIHCPYDDVWLCIHLALKLLSFICYLYDVPLFCVINSFWSMFQHKALSCLLQWTKFKFTRLNVFSCIGLVCQVVCYTLYECIIGILISIYLTHFCLTFHHLPLAAANGHRFILYIHGKR